ncbi:claudin-1 [Myripristis murdjan]|uniref:claudin-1 n=1 Tax=Myripristis murdjan TaxID=586833 RepID=UPI0011761DE0|nr:claudin-1-like [Myripristis murdjan]
MASSGVQLLGFLLCLIGLAATIAATYMVEWKKHHEGNHGTHQTYEGLWMTCSGQSERMTCELHESLLKLPAEIQVTRAVMLLSIFLSSVALMVATVGMKCTRFLETKEQSKSIAAMAAGIMFMISGILTLAITSWYVRKIVQSFYGSHHLSRHEFGSAVFVSWAGAILTLTGGVFLSCRRCSRRGSSMTVPQLHAAQGANYV